MNLQFLWRTLLRKFDGLVILKMTGSDVDGRAGRLGWPRIQRLLLSGQIEECVLTLCLLPILFLFLSLFLFFLFCSMPGTAYVSLIGLVYAYVFVCVIFVCLDAYAYVLITVIFLGDYVMVLPS